MWLRSIAFGVAPAMPLRTHRGLWIPPWESLHYFIIIYTSIIYAYLCRLYLLRLSALSYKNNQIQLWIMCLSLVNKHQRERLDGEIKHSRRHGFHLREQHRTVGWDSALMVFVQVTPKLHTVNLQHTESLYWHWDCNSSCALMLS